ncbi:MAG: hypothetical protein KIT44_03965 [Opitutaceae bacterium]|nr:hypothetical protein [Opitutaceae bacterium]
MKNKNNLIKSFLGFLFVGALALPLAVTAVPVQPLAAITAAAEGETVTGRVVAKSATVMIVEGHSLLLTDATVYVQGGRTISPDDVKTGAEVRVSTTPGSDGSLLAVTVELLTAAD